MTYRNGRAMIDALKVTRPDVAIVVTREEDPYGDWVDDEPIDTDIYTCYEHTVTALCIRNGEIIKGEDYLGGSWYDVHDPDPDNQACLREISGYLPQLIDEALADLDEQLNALQQTGPKPSPSNRT